MILSTNLILSHKLSLVHDTCEFAHVFFCYPTQFSSIMNRPKRFNEKARQSSAIASSHKRGKQRRPRVQSATDTNLEIVQLKSTEEKDLDRREQLKKEVIANPLEAISVSPVVVACTVTIKGVEQEEEEVR